MEAYREERKNVKTYIYKSEEEMNEQFGKKMNEDVTGNNKNTVLDGGVSKANRGKAESCSTIKDENGRFALEEVEMRRIREE